MLSLLFLYVLLIAIAWQGLINPKMGVIGFYFWVVLEPEWNWRWVFPRDANFQQIIVASIVIGLLFRGLKFKSASSISKWSIACLISYLGLSYLAAQNSISPPLSEFYMGNLWKIVLMTCLCVLLIDDLNSAWLLLLAIAIAQAYSAFRINEQYLLEGFTRFIRSSWGSKGDNNLFSNLTIPALCCSFCLALHSSNPRVRYPLFLIAILQVHQIMLLESRGAFLGVLMAVCLVLWTAPKNQSNYRFFFASSVIGVMLAGPPVMREFNSIWVAAEERDGSAQSRIELWKAGIAITKANPILGVGPYAAQTLVPAYLSQETNRKGLHNQILQVSAGSGIPAACLYLSFFAFPWLSAVKNRKIQLREGGTDGRLMAIYATVISAIPSYFIASCFSAGSLSETPYAVAAVGLSASSIIWRERRKSHSHLVSKQAQCSKTDSEIYQHA